MAGLDDATKLKRLQQKNYKEQCVSFLNAFWEREPVNFGAHPDQVEVVWQIFQKCIKITKSEQGTDLDEFQAHRCFEATDGALTVQEMRRVLNEADIDFNKRISLLEILIYRFHVDWHVLVNAPLGGANAKVTMAQEKVGAANTALQVAIQAEEVADQELKASIAAEEKAEEDEKTSIARAAQAKLAEEEVICAQNDSKAAVAAVAAQEKEREDKLAELELMSSNDLLSTVKRNKAKAELAQVKQEDPMPLRKARINQEAALRRVTRALKDASTQSAAAAAAAIAAAKAKRDAEAAHVASIASAENAHLTRESVEKALKEAQDFLEETKALYCGTWEGTMWWLKKELDEARRFLPKSKIKQLEAVHAEEAAKLVSA